MYLFVNELSINGQAANNYAARELMSELMDLAVRFRKLPRAIEIYSHSTFHSRILAPNLSVVECLRTLKKHDAARLFFQLATGGKYIDRILTEKAPNLVCQFGGLDVSRSALAGSVYFQGFLGSLGNAIDFGDSTVSLHFSDNNGSDWQDVDVRNFIDADVLHNQLWRKYAASPKHAAGGWGTLMDLDDDTAEHCLNDGIQSHGAQVYGCHEGRLYEFQPDGTGSFHGYPVCGNEVPVQVLQQMRDVGVFTAAEYRRLLGEVA